MCLNIGNTIEKLIAETDIVCYKALCGYGQSYKTPFRKEEINIGSTYKSKLSVEKDFNGWLIEKGLHSFKTLDAAKFLVDNHYGSFVAKCIIPKGSYYFKGTFNNRISYASDTLTYVKIVKIKKKCV